MHCGAKNPDTARFCNNCGKAMNSAPAGGSSPVQKNTKKSGGFFKRILITIVVFCVFYSASYAITSLTSSPKSSAKKDTSSGADSIQIEYTLPEVAAQPETGYIADLGGYWEQVKLKDGNSNLNVSALSFSQTVYNCTELTVTMEVTMNSGTSCKDWQVWGRSGNSFVKIGKVYLPNGNGYVSQTLVFPHPITFDSIAITPTISGGYSWSMALGITDVYCE